MGTWKIVVGTVEADRYVHGHNPWLFTETDSGPSGFPQWTLTVPHVDGNLTAREGDWIIVDSNAVNHVCPDDLFRALFAP